MNQIHRRREAGFSLVMTLVAVAIAGIVAVVISKVIADGQQGMRHVELRGDLEAIRQVLMTQIDCQGTFDQNGITDTNVDALCKTKDDDVQRAGDKPLVLYRDTTDGPKRLIKGDLQPDGSVKFGSWWLRATCSKAGSSIVVRAARKTADGKSFATDPLTKTPQDWTSNNGLVIGATVAPICFTKGLMTGEMHYAQRVFDWNPNRAPHNRMQMGDIEVMAGSELAAFHQPNPMVGPGAFKSHGITCAKNFKILSCTEANTLAISSGLIRKTVNQAGVSFTYDTDPRIDAATNGCWTNDPDQIRDSNPAPTESFKVILRAVCVKVR